MSAFHPAVRGILEAALTQHEQARALMRVAGDETAETAGRYSEIVDGLTRLISLATPVEYGVLPADGLERVRASYLMAGRMMTALADIELSAWSFGASNRDVDAMLSGRGGDARATIGVIAGRIGVPYTERRHGTTGNSLMIAAEGRIEGIPVRFWKLITAERPFCDRHHQMLTEADVCEQCENPGVDPAAVDDLGPMHCIRHSTPPIPPGGTCPECDPPTGEPDGPAAGYSVEQLLEADDPDDDALPAELLDLDDDAEETGS
ncbi:MAG TPA: hypothetical protein VK547_09600 [Candidatus Udaeobacter sp.]|nr:hypothetical protein [Candidatus Udaeobacter sp.]